MFGGLDSVVYGIVLVPAYVAHFSSVDYVVSHNLVNDVFVFVVYTMGSGMNEGGCSIGVIIVVVDVMSVEASSLLAAINSL